MATSKRITTIIKAFERAEEQARETQLDAALAEIHGRVDVALEYELPGNLVEARSVAEARFPEKSEGAKRSQFLLVVETAANYARLAEIARKSHAEAVARGLASSRVAGKYLVAAKLLRANSKLPTVEDVLAEGKVRDKSAAITLVETRYKNLLKYAKDNGVIVKGELTFTVAAATPAPMGKEALAALLKAQGINAKELAALLKS